MAVDYGAGASSAMAAQYADLRQAIASKGDAENRREARNIESKGLFGSGIKQSDIQDFGNIAIKGAQFGEARMGRKMDRATQSFDRRMKADERRLKTLQKRHDKGQLTTAGMAELDGIQMGMKENRDSFEDYMGKYEKKGLWGTSFGGDDVGYRTGGESKWSRNERSKAKPGSVPPGSVPGEFNDVRDLGDFDRSPSQPGIDQKLSGKRKIGENAPLGGDPMTWENNPLNPKNKPNKYEEKFGEGPPSEDVDSPYSTYPHQPREYENIASGDRGMMNMGSSQGLSNKEMDRKRMLQQWTSNETDYNDPDYQFVENWKIK